MNNDIAKQLQKIEKIAQKILQNKLSIARKDIEMKRLYNLIYNLEADYAYSEFRHLRNSLIRGNAVIKQELENSGSHYLIIVETAQETLQSFKSTADINFMTKFKAIYYYKIKKFIRQQITEVHGTDNDNLKLAKIKEVLLNLIDEKYLQDKTARDKLRKAVHNTTVLNYDRIKKLLIQDILQIKVEDTANKIWENFANKYINTQYVIANEQQGESENYFLTDKLGYSDTNEQLTKEAEHNILHLAEKVEKLNAKLKNIDLQRYLTGLITILILKFELTYHKVSLLLKPYIDEKLKQYYLAMLKQQDIDAIKPETILAQYLHMKPDTIRKYPNKIKLKINIIETEILAKNKLIH